MKRPTPAKLQQQCDEFNAMNPVGSAVHVRLDNGTSKETTTRTEAQVLMGHSAVVWLHGITGCYLLERVWPADLSKQESAE